MCPGEEAQSQAGVSGSHLGPQAEPWPASKGGCRTQRLSANKIMSVDWKVGGGAPPNKTGSSITMKNKT